MMKAFVLDQGWAGAEIYFAETDAEGIQYHRQQQASFTQAEIDRYHRGRDENYINQAVYRLQYIISEDFVKSITIYDVVPGLLITTDGE